MSKKSRVIFHVILFFFGYSSLYVVRNALSVSADFLETSGILSIIQYSLAGSLFFAFYASGRFINGYIGDYVQPKILISLGICLSGLCSIVIGLFPVSSVILVAWAVNAYAQSMVWSPMLVYVVADKPKNKELDISILGAAVPFGTALGTILVSKVLAKYGIQIAFYIPGLLAIICGLLVLVVCREKIDLGISDKKEKNPFALLSNPQFKTLIVPFMVNGVLKDGIPLWMVVYITKTFGVDLSQISGYVIFIPLLGGISRLLFEPLRKICKSEITLALFSFCMSLMFAILLFMGSISVTVAVISLALIYAFASVANMSFVGIFPLRFVESNCTSLASGLVDLAIYAGAGISTLALGFVVDKFGFGLMFLFWAVLCAVSVLFLFNFTRRFEIKKA